MTSTFINVVLVAVLLVLGVFGLVRALQTRSSGGHSALPLARAIGCIVVAVALAVVTATAIH